MSLVRDRTKKPSLRLLFFLFTISPVVNFWTTFSWKYSIGQHLGQCQKFSRKSFAKVLCVRVLRTPVCFSRSTCDVFIKRFWSRCEKPAEFMEARDLCNLNKYEWVSLIGNSRPWCNYTLPRVLILSSLDSHYARVRKPNIICIRFVTDFYGSNVRVNPVRYSKHAYCSYENRTKNLHDKPKHGAF